ncbi:MAG: T9SS type A sorting domain-containing protein [Chitinophagales bacterium]
MKYFSLFCLLLLANLICLEIQAQTYINKQLVYSSTGNFNDNEDEEFNAVIQLNNNAYLMAGTQSNNGVEAGLYSFLVAKVNNNLELEWSYTFDNDEIDIAHALIETSNGEYIILGTSGYRLISSDVTTDVWIIKLNNNGDLLWQKTYGGTGNDAALKIIGLENEEYMVAGYTNSTDGDINNALGGNDAWLFKINTEGDLLWENTYGGIADDKGNDLIYNIDNQEFILVGATASIETQGGQDFWICSLDIDGNMNWQEAYGGPNLDSAKNAVFDNEGNIYVLGSTLSQGGDVSITFGNGDFWLIKLSNQGDLVWEKTIGDANFDIPTGLIKDNNDDILLVGSTFDPSVTPPNFFYDIRVTRINNTNSNVIWDNNIGGSKWDFGNTIILNNAGKYIVAGFTDSSDGDVGGIGHAAEVAARHGADNGWIFELVDINVGIGINAANSDNLPIEIVSNFIQDKLLLDISKIQNNALDIVLYNTHGQKVFQKKCDASYLKSSLTINLPKLSSNIYYLQVSDGNDFFTQKIMIHQ